MIRFVFSKSSLVTAWNADWSGAGVAPRDLQGGNCKRKQKPRPVGNKEMEKSEQICEVKLTGLGY